MGDGFKSYERVCVRRDKPLSKHGLEFGELVVRISNGEDIPDAVRNHVMSHLEMMGVPLPQSVTFSTMYDFARLYDGFIGIVGIIAAKNRSDDRRERRRSVWRTLRALVLIVGLVFLFLALSNWLDRYFEYDVDKWLCVLLSALICGSAAMVVFFHRFVYRKVVAVTKWARLLVRKFEEDTRP